jgi:hypothetical protein
MQAGAAEDRAGRLAALSAGKKLMLLAGVNLVFFTVLLVVGEVGFRLFWHPKYSLKCERLFFGSGITTAGRKYLPDATYTISSPEFRIRFRTSAKGYRARPEPPRTADPYRIAFVGDSFTEGMQVEYDQTFCALIERRLAGALPGREVVCENFGIAATGLFEYWHRIAHDVLRPDPPDALILCVYPGNDFTGEFPTAGFGSDGRPLHDYYHDATWTKHLLTWLNFNSQLARYLQERIHGAQARLVPYEAPRLWWTDPVKAAGASGAPVIARSRALLRAIADDCHSSGTRLCILVVGPVPTYRAWHGQSPLGQICADWQIDAPVFDVAIEAVSRPDFRRLLFPRDGHLNPAGHAHLAAAATPILRATLFPSVQAANLP